MDTVFYKLLNRLIYVILIAIPSCAHLSEL